MESMFGKIVKEVLVERDVKAALNEVQSVSPEVAQATNEVILKIVNTIERNTWHDGKNECQGFKTMVFSIKPKFSNNTFSKLSYIKVTVIDFVDRRTLEDYGYLLDGSFYYDYNVIDVVIPWYDGKLDIKTSSSILSHELTHTYQHILGYTNDFRQLNTKADKLLMKYNSDEEISDFLYLLYYLKKEEIDAKVQELASDLRTVKPKRKEDAYSTPIPLNLNRIKDVEKNSKNNSKIDHVISELGVDKQWLFNYLEKQIRYAESKYRKVIGWFLNRDKGFLKELRPPKGLILIR